MLAPNTSVETRSQFLEIQDYIKNLGENIETETTAINLTSEEQKEIPLVLKVRGFFFWTLALSYFILYFVLFGLVVTISTYGTTEFSIKFILTITIVEALIFSLISTPISFFIIRYYHLKHPTPVNPLRFMEYKTVYSNPVRKRLWWGNAFPWLYITFLIVPLVSRLHYYLLYKFDRGTKATKSRPKRDEDKFKCISEFLVSRLNKNYSSDSQIGVLKDLFQRRSQEISSKVQRISIFLSTIGIGVSLVALLFQEQLKNLPEFMNKPLTDKMILIAIVSILVFLMSLVINQIGRLLLVAKNRQNINLLLDALDILSIRESNQT